MTGGLTTTAYSGLTATEQAFFTKLNPGAIGSNSATNQSNLFVEGGTNFKSKGAPGFQTIAIGVNANLVRGINIKPMLAAVTEDYKNVTAFGGVSAEVEPRIIYTGANPNSQKSRQMSQEGVYFQGKASFATPIAGVSVKQDKLSILAEKYVGLKGVFDQEGKYSASAGIRMNDYIAGGKEGQANFTVKLPFGDTGYSKANPVFSKSSRCQSGGAGDLYFRVGVGNNFETKDLNANLALGIHF